MGYYRDNKIGVLTIPGTKPKTENQDKKNEKKLEVPSAGFINPPGDANSVPAPVAES
jgi:hypothetical protein